MKYSTAAIGAALRDSLGQSGSSGAPRVVSFIDNPTQDAEAYLAMTTCGIDTSHMPAADTAKSQGWTTP